MPLLPPEVVPPPPVAAFSRPQGQQGQLEAMYRKMYETQPTSGEQQTSQREVSLGFARVLDDRDDGVVLGVSGTPTFFVNGAQFQGRPTYEALKSVIARELVK